MKLRDEVDAVLSSTIEQSDAVQRISRGIREGQQQYDVSEVMTMLGAILGAHRDALLRIADEVDRLRIASDR